MKYKNKVAVAVIILIAISIGIMQVYLVRNPLVELGSNAPGGVLFDSQTQAGKAFLDLSECATKQEGLYQYIEVYMKKHGKAPSDVFSMINDNMQCMYFTTCPLGHAYKIFPENYGKSNAVFISDEKHDHQTTFQFWGRGVKPCVQTMGDGKIHLFQGGKVATRQVKRIKSDDTENLITLEQNKGIQIDAAAHRD